MAPDSLRLPQHIRIEGPIGAIEADTGSPMLDGVLVVSVILVLYFGKKVVDKIFKK